MGGKLPWESRPLVVGSIEAVVASQVVDKTIRRCWGCWLYQASVMGRVGVAIHLAASPTGEGKEAFFVTRGVSVRGLGCRGALADLVKSDVVL